MNKYNNDISNTFEFLNFAENKRDITQSKLLENPDIYTFIDNIVTSLNKITNIFRIGAYKVTFLDNKDRENEIKDIKIKSKMNKDFKSFNVDKTVYHKLTMCVVIDEKRLISDSDIESNQIRRANAKFLNGLKLDGDWTFLEDVEDFSYGDIGQHSCQVVHMKVPDINFSFVEINSKVYYLTYNEFNKISFYGQNKIHVNRFSCQLDQQRTNIIRPYYFISQNPETKIINVEFDKKEYNLFRILDYFNIQNDLLETFPNDEYLAYTWCEYENDPKISNKTITKAEFDKELIVDGVLTLRGYKPASSFKYYRYGSIIDAISVEIVANIVSSLPRSTGKVGERYFHASPEDIQKGLSAIEATFKHNLFMAILAKSGHESLKSTFNENSVFYPMRVTRNPGIHETIFKEEDLQLLDVYGTSQTKKNILKVVGVPPFIDPKYLG